MPNPAEYENQEDFMKACVPMMIGEGKDNDAAVGACMGMWNDHTDAAKYRILTFGAVKAVGDWELDVLAIPFGSRDSDGQWFDDRTDIMENAFTTPLAIYQHGVSQGSKTIDEKPVIVGKSVAGTLKKMLDGWHVRVILNKTIKQAKYVMDAARKRMAAVSSGSIAHLARLDVGGKLIQYEKDRPGRIAVWPLAEVSLWEKGNGNHEPANQFAFAMPAMKAMYKEAGLPFPDVDTHGVSQALEVRRRAKVTQAQTRAKLLLKNLEKLK